MNGFVCLLWMVYPVIVIIGVNYIMQRFQLHQRFSLKSVDFATLLLLVGLHKLTELLYTDSIVPYLFISIFLLGISVAVFQAYYYEEIKWRRFFKMFWRLTFILCIIVYLVLDVCAIGSIFRK